MKKQEILQNKLLAQKMPLPKIISSNLEDIARQAAKSMGELSGI
jgi:hypothetical protein